MSAQIYQTYTFLPTQISGCQLWLDGADLTTLFTDIAGTTPVSASGQTVSYWKDKSSQANNATNSTNQPTVTYGVQSGQSVLTFNGTQYLSLTPEKLPNGSANSSYFFVVRTSSSALQVFMANGTPATNQMFQCYYNSYNFIGDLYGGSEIRDGTTYNNQFAVVSYTAGATFTGYDFNSPFSGTNSINITLNTGTTWALLGVTRITTPNPAFIYYLTGQIAEVIVYNRIVSTSEREQLQAYLGWKWNLNANFTSTFTYKNNPPFMNTIQLPALPSRPIQIFNTPVFVPTQISGCQLWLDAADSSTVSLSGTTVTSWNNKVPSGIATTTVSSPSLSGNYLNRIQTLRFNGNSITATLSTPVGTGDYAMFAVWLTINGGTEAVLSIGPNGGPAAGLGYNGAYYNLYEWGQTESQYVAGKNQYVLESGTRVSGIKTVFYNGISGTPASGTLNLTNTTLFVGNGTGFPINGEIGEVILYQATLTTAQRQQVEGYLAWKWGLQGSLPTTHPYYKSPFPNQTIAPSPAYPPRITSIQWLPNRVSGLSLWLDAADKSTLTGTNVTSWTDKSGQGNTATASVGPTQSTYNKYPVLTFNGSTQFMISANTVPRTTHTLIAVHRPVTITASFQGNTSLFRYQVPGPNYIVFPYMFGLTPRGYITSADGAGAGSIDSANSTLVENSSTSAFNIIIAVISSGSQVIYKNGTQQSSDTETLTGATSDSLTIGRFTPGLSEYYEGDLGEMIVYPSSLSTRNRQQVEGYLAWKWGLQGTLPSNHPYKLFPPQP
jgi:hypothetical protein